MVRSPGQCISLYDGRLSFALKSLCKQYMYTSVITREWRKKKRWTVKKEEISHSNASFLRENLNVSKVYINIVWNSSCFSLEWWKTRMTVMNNLATMQKVNEFLLSHISANALTKHINSFKSRNNLNFHWKLPNICLVFKVVNYRTVTEKHIQYDAVGYCKQWQIRIAKKRATSTQKVRHTNEFVEI